MTLEALQPKPRHGKNGESATVLHHPQMEGREVAALARQLSECPAPAEASQTRQKLGCTFAASQQRKCRDSTSNSQTTSAFGVLKLTE